MDDPGSMAIAQGCQGSRSRSTLPPVTMTPTRRPATGQRASSRQASGTAAEGSMTIFIRSHVMRIARTIAVFAAGPERGRRARGSRRERARRRACVRSPSAIVVVGGSGSTGPKRSWRRRRPRSRARRRRPRCRARTPSRRSPCPTAARRRRRARHDVEVLHVSRASSSAAVPCPAMTSRVVEGMDHRRAGLALYIGTRGLACRDIGGPECGSSRRSAARSPASPVAALSGITTHAGMPRRAPHTRCAAPWLPDECVTTPRAATVVGSENTALRRAARLERADVLEVLALEEQPRADLRVDRRAGEHRRAMHVRADALVRRADRGEVRQCERGSSGRSSGDYKGGRANIALRR